jgi:uncharacterized SAM-binding protein YcdF (DUF218 family)
VFFIPASRAKRFLSLFLLTASLLSWPPCEYLLSRPLEWQYPVRPFSAPAGLDAIVVLGNAVSPPHFERPYPLPNAESYGRCQHAAWIHRKTGLPVLVSGGLESDWNQTVAATMRDLILAAGVPADMIWVEDRSRSTHENARFSAEVLRRHGARHIALVVDAQSMLRASACFRKEGLEVTAAPSRFSEVSANVEGWILGWKAVRGNELTLHEALGVCWYWLRGWI